jgi:hypothetical protein
MLDGDVMPAQFEPDRITRADVQQLLKKVSVRPDHEIFFCGAAGGFWHNPDRPRSGRYRIESGPRNRRSVPS